METIRAAIVGCGRISDLHILGYKDREDARIVAVCDPREKAAAALAKKAGCSKVYTDYHQVLEDPEIDLVELLVPHHVHCGMTVQAAQAGKHISVQKPMAMDIREADEMIAAARSAGVILRIYENFVFYPPNVAAKKIVESGEIGDPQMIRLHVSTGKSKTAWKIPLTAWFWRFQNRSAGGGPLVFDHGYHLFSLAMDLMGEVEKVSAFIDKSPVMPGINVDAPAVIQFKFKKPRRYGQLDFAHTPNLVMDSIYYADDDRVEVIGDRGVVIVNRCTAKTLDLPPVLLFKDGKTRPVPVDRFEWHDAFIDCTTHLLDAIRTGTPPRLSGETGRDVLRFVLAALTSAEQHREVTTSEVYRNPLLHYS
jgi:predicted dehydrogenase